VPRRETLGSSPKLTAGALVDRKLRFFANWAKSGKGREEFHVGPHLMIVAPHQDDFQGVNRDPLNGMPYVTHLPNRSEPIPGDADSPMGRAGRS